MSKSDPFVVHGRNSKEARHYDLPSELTALKVRRKVIFMRVLFFVVIALVLGLALSLLPAVVWVHIGWIIFGIICIIVGMGHVAGFVFLCTEYGKDVQQYKKAKKNGVVEDE